MTEKQLFTSGFPLPFLQAIRNAVVAASEFDNVYCVDSKSLCTGMGLLVLKACDLRNKKFDAKKIARRLEGLVSKVIPPLF